MNRYLILLLATGFVYADNEIYVDQSGNTASIDLEQIGSSNLIGGTSAVSGTMTALDLDGTTMTLDINQIGSSNQFKSDAIDGDNFTGFFEFDGDSNVWDLLMNSTGLITSDYVDLNIDVTGSSNEADIKIAENANASYLNLDWIITGDSNEFDFDIDYENAVNYMDVNGSSNTFNITQASTLARDWISIIANTSHANICVIQNDGGTTTSC